MKSIFTITMFTLLLLCGVFPYTELSAQQPEFTYYRDSDGDGYGTDETIASEDPTPPQYYATASGDCNDDNSAVNPGATEICGNEIDDNCDGEIDEGCPVYTYYLDVDDDGYGGEWWIQSTNVTPPERYVLIGGDCYDQDNSVNPGATEVCNMKDDNCDGIVDEGCLKEQLPDFTKDDINGVTHHFYDDLAAGKAVIIEFSAGWCVPSQIAEPQIAEVFDNICQGNGNVKLYDIVYETQNQGEESDDAYGHVYANHYNATYPVITNSRELFFQFAYQYSKSEIPWILVVIPNTSDPSKSTVYHFVGVTEDLKANIENVLTSNGFPINAPPALNITVTGNVCDLPSPVTLTSSQPTGNVWSTGATSRSITVTTPGTYTVSYTAGCGTMTKKVYIAERTAATTLVSSGTTSCANKGVFNLTYDGVHPGAVLEYSLDQSKWETAADNFYGQRSFINQWDAGITIYFRVKEKITNSIGLPDCEAYSNTVQIQSQALSGDPYEITASGDCNFPITLTSPIADNVYWSTEETTQSITVNSPGLYFAVATASCGDIYDEIIVNGSSTWYRDADDDGHGDWSNSTVACTQPEGYVLDNRDCNDEDANIHPGAREICNNGIDDNCDGQIDEECFYNYFLDQDGDGYGDAGSSIIDGPEAPPGYSPFAGDCNDNNSLQSPVADEICDGIDNNCNGLIDEGVSGVTFYRDKDGDGYGNPSVTTMGSCNGPAPRGYVRNNSDCNDSKAGIHPGATEICDGIDNDCDGVIDEGIKTTFYRDADGDGYGGTSSSTIQACSKPTGYSALNTDCNDGNASIRPGGAEVCGNGIDDNCNGEVDEGCSARATISINDITVYESQGVAVMTVSLSGITSQSVQVKYTTVAKGTASSGKDYTSTKGTLTIPAGSLSSNISISISQDNQNEQSEYFDVQLSQPVNATLADGMGRVTILNGTAPLITSNESRLTTNEEMQTLTGGLKVQAWPNPSTHRFTLLAQSNFEGTLQIKVSNILGHVVEIRQRVATNSTIYLGDHYMPGVYFVELLQGDRRQVLKLIKR